MKYYDFKLTQNIIESENKKVILYLAKNKGYYLIRIKHGREDYTMKKYKKISHVQKWLDEYIEGIKKANMQGLKFYDYNIIML